MENIDRKPRNLYPNSTAHSLTLSLSKKSRLDLASSALFKPPLTNVIHVPRQKATGRDTAARERWVIAARPRDFSARLSASARHADANASSSSCLRRSRRARTPSATTRRARRTRSDAWRRYVYEGSLEADDGLAPRARRPRQDEAGATRRWPSSPRRGARGGARRDLDRAAARSGGSFPGGWC